MAAKTGVIEGVLGTIPPGMALDVATGAGNFAAAVKRFAGGNRAVIAVDAYIKPLQMITGNPEMTGIIPAAMRGEQLALADSSFSAVSISNSLHHMTDPSAVIKEMTRVLSPGGMLLIIEMFSDGEQAPSQRTHTILHNWWAAVDSYSGVIHNPVFSRGALEELATASGIPGIEFGTFEDVSADPFDEETIDQLKKVCNSYAKRAEGSRKLMASGEAALAHLDKHGFHGTRALVARGLKPTL